MSLGLAIREALKNPIEARGRNSISRFATILTDGYRTFTGLNSYKTCTWQARFARHPECIHLHSEIAAIKKAFNSVYSNSNLFGKFKPLRRYKMSIARVLADGTPALAYPCEGCLSAIVEFGIEEVEWTE